VKEAAPDRKGRSPLPSDPYGTRRGVRVHQQDRARRDVDRARHDSVTRGHGSQRRVAVAPSMFDLLTSRVSATPTAARRRAADIVVAEVSCGLCRSTSPSSRHGGVRSPGRFLARRTDAEDLGPLEARRELRTCADTRRALRQVQVHVPAACARRVSARARCDPRLVELQGVRAAWTCSRRTRVRSARGGLERTSAGRRRVRWCGIAGARRERRS
jgi:hypothetical protein